MKPTLKHIGASIRNIGRSYSLPTDGPRINYHTWN